MWKVSRALKTNRDVRFAIPIAPYAGFVHVTASRGLDSALLNMTDANCKKFAFLSITSRL
jgi:hypothetical protein